MAANRATNFKNFQGLLPPNFEGVQFFSNFKIRGPQPVCREPSVARFFSAFDFLSCFLLHDEAVEPYLQRHPYTFEVQERVMPGATQRAPFLLTLKKELENRI